MGSCLSSDGRQESPCSPSSPGSDSLRKKRSKKRQTSVRSSSLDSKRSGQLQKIPGRLFSNGASRCASLFSQQGRKGTNQDAMIFWENFGSRAGTIFCGVFDGHGPFGHMVAKKVRDSLPIKLSNLWDLNIENDNSKDTCLNNFGDLDFEESILCMEETEPWMALGQDKKQPHIFITLKDVFLRSFKVMDGELRKNSSIDSFSSGTTAVILVKQGQDVVIGNVGDSRAVLGTRDENDNLVAVQLTVDLKPDLPSKKLSFEQITVDLKPDLPRERERIRLCKGRVFALQDEPEVARVWLPNNDAPGLAMARAFGDFCLKDYGLISVPDISYRRLTQGDEFIVLATDGVWDVLSNKQVVDAVASAPTQSSAARFVVESAVKAWKYKYPSSHVDDCAVVCLFLNADPCSSRASYSDFKDRATKLSSYTEVCSGDKGPVALKRSGTVRSTTDILFDAT